MSSTEPSMPKIRELMGEVLDTAIDRAFMPDSLQRTVAVIIRNGLDCVMQVTEHLVHHGKTLERNIKEQDATIASLAKRIADLESKP